MSDWHVTPIDDLKEHLLSRACWCRPKIEIEPDETALVIHHSLDGREHFEPEGDTAKETVQ